MLFYCIKMIYFRALLDILKKMTIFAHCPHLNGVFVIAAIPAGAATFGS